MTTSEQSLAGLDCSPAIPREAEGRSPSAQTAPLGKILLTDYWSFVLVLLNLAALITVAFIPALLLLVPLLVRRVRGIRGIFAAGKATTGVIVRKRFLRGEWLLVYGFKTGEEIVQTRNFVLGFKLPVKERDLVTVIYDPEKPTRAFLPILYAPALDRLGGGQAVRA